MSSIIITKEDALKLLSKSFEQGYEGYLDLKDDCILTILEDYLKSKGSNVVQGTSMLSLSSSPSPHSISHNPYPYNHNYNYSHQGQYQISTNDPNLLITNLNLENIRIDTTNTSGQNISLITS